MIGLKRGTVKLSRYNARWNKSFDSEARKIRKILGASTLGLQHVGSTAIRGIMAKPIIDIAVIVPSFKKVMPHVKSLQGVGYLLKKENRKDRMFFIKGPEAKRTHYLHVGEIGSGYAEDMIAFRDYLRKHKDTAKEYNELKSKLAEKYSDNREVYTMKKEKFIKKII